MREFVEPLLVGTKKAMHPLVAVMGALTLAQINEALGCLASLFAIAYTLWHWRRESKGR